MNRIAASYLIIGDGSEPIRNGFVEYDETGCICNVGQCEHPETEPDFRDGILTPGFVNSHCHLELSHLKGKFVKGSGMAGFIDQINALRDSSPEEEKIRLAHQWLDKMWKDGVSAMSDISNCSDTFAIKASSKVYTRTFLEVFGTEPEDCEAVIRGVRQLKEEADSYGIDAAPTPHSCYTMSPQLLTAASAEALKAGYLSYHSQESPQEEDMIMYGTGALAENYKGRNLSTPPVTGHPALNYFIDRLTETGKSHFSEHILLVHNVCLSQQAADYALGALDNVWFAVCPLSNLFIHNQLPPLDLMRANDLRITLGTDSLSSNDTLDMVAEMFCIQKSFPHIPLSEIVRWASLNGAEFLSKENVLGSLSAGKRPGIVLINEIDADGNLTEKSHSQRII